MCSLCWNKCTTCSYICLRINNPAVADPKLVNNMYNKNCNNIITINFQYTPTWSISPVIWCSPNALSPLIASINKVLDEIIEIG